MSHPMVALNSASQMQHTPPGPFQVLDSVSCVLCTEELPPKGGGRLIRGALEISQTQEAQKSPTVMRGEDGPVELISLWAEAQLSRDTAFWFITSAGMGFLVTPFESAKLLYVSPLSYSCVRLQQTHWLTRLDSDGITPWSAVSVLSGLRCCSCVPRKSL